MDLLTAIQILEQDIDSTPEEQIQAWAHLIETGHAWTLQGAYGRAAAGLIEDGMITPMGNITPAAWERLAGLD